MRTSIRRRLITAALATGLLVGAAQGLTASPAQAYPAGNTSGHISYSPSVGGMVWYCSYSSWSAVPKYWSCDLWDSNRTVKLQNRDGSFTASSVTLASRVYRGHTSGYAVHAAAGYNDGSASTSSWKYI